jgi:Leucine-rich repeat (LRR) protein
MDFSAFVNLEELDLSGNKITDITKMGLESLKKLRVLDVSKNEINSSLKEVLALLHSIVL